MLVHTFDTLDGVGARPDVWNPCPRDQWCGPQGADRAYSLSLLNAHLPHFFNQAMGGFILSSEVLSPAHSTVVCAYAFDGGSIGQMANGCPAPACDNLPWRFSAGSYCHWPGSGLKSMLEQHEDRLAQGIKSKCGGQTTCDYNEVVIMEKVWRDRFPAVVEAIFFPRGEAKGEETARRVHAAFVRDFPQQPMPLVSYDVSGGGGGEAFELA